MSHIHHECELERHIVEQLAVAGWLIGKSAAYDAGRTLFPEDVLGWLEDTQPQTMAKLRSMHGADAEKVVLARLVKLNHSLFRRHVDLPLLAESSGSALTGPRNSPKANNRVAKLKAMAMWRGAT